MSEDSLTENEKSYYKTLLANNAEKFEPSNGTKTEYQKYLGAFVDTPLGKVRMGANQYDKFVNKKRTDLFIATRKTLESPVLIFTAENNSKVYVKSFVTDVGKQKNIISVTIVKGDDLIAITTHEERLNQILNKMKKTGILYEKAPGL